MEYKMNTFKKGLFAGAAALAMSMSAQAENVGGVVWDPNSIFAFPDLTDFISAGTLFESSTTGIPGDIVTGSGNFSNLNSATGNVASFCPGCELTFTFDMELVSLIGVPAANGLGGIDGTFTFKDLDIRIFVDHTPNYDGSDASAADGDLWLFLESFGLVTGTGENLGSGSDKGTGGSLLDVSGGLAAANFDTNTRIGGADMVFSSSFQPVAGAPGVLSGTFELTGNSIAIPEPSTIALLGLGLLGFAGARRRKA